MNNTITICLCCKNFCAITQCKYCNDYIQNAQKNGYGFCWSCFQSEGHSIVATCQSCQKTTCGYEMYDQTHCFACFSNIALQKVQTLKNDQLTKVIYKTLLNINYK